MSKNIEKTTTEGQDAVAAIKESIESFKTHEEQAAYIGEKFPAIKRAYQARHKERSEEIEAAIRRPAKDAPIDDLIKANEDLKQRHYQREVRENTIDRLERQIMIGKTSGWEKALIGVFNDMDSMINGEIYAA